MRQKTRLLTLRYWSLSALSLTPSDVVLESEKSHSASLRSTVIPDSGVSCSPQERGDLLAAQLPDAATAGVE